LNGYQKKDSSWYLNDDIEDTIFTGYSHPKRSEILFFSYVQDKKSLEMCCTEMLVVAKRLESRSKDILDKIDNAIKSIEQSNTELGLTHTEPVSPLSLRRTRAGLEETMNKKAELENKMEMLQNAKFSIILSTEITELKSNFTDEYIEGVKESTIKPKLCIGDTKGVQLDSISVVFKYPSL
jgi:hypothetical protein